MHSRAFFDLYSYRNLKFNFHIHYSSIHQVVNFLPLRETNEKCISENMFCKWSKHITQCIT